MAHCDDECENRLMKAELALADWKELQREVPNLSVKEVEAIQDRAEARGDALTVQLTKLLLHGSEVHEQGLAVTCHLAETAKEYVHQVDRLGLKMEIPSEAYEASCRLRELLEGLEKKPEELFEGLPKPEAITYNWEEGRPGEATVRLGSHWASRFLAHGIAAEMRKVDKTYWNHVKYDLSYKDGTRFFVLVQRADGKTPDQVADERVRELMDRAFEDQVTVEALKKKIEALQDAAAVQARGTEVLVAEVNRLRMQAEGDKAALDFRAAEIKRLEDHATRMQRLLEGVVEQLKPPSGSQAPA